MTSQVKGGDTSDAEDASGAASVSVPGDASAASVSVPEAAPAAEGLGGAASDVPGDAPAAEDLDAAPHAPGDTSEPGGSDAGPGVAPGDASGRSRRPPALTTDTARPEGGGRAAAGDASAPARQWPLLTVLGIAALGLLVVGTDLFAQSFRVGTILVGIALLTGAGLRRALPSVGMLAVRSRFTDMVTYGVMGGLIVLLALMAQPSPWLKIPFLEDILHLTIT
ncbi:DUF3017 domain-containing protein [Streptomyces sp. Je 1-79]|uniref:DUF3017 domain-containing protein n=1 Tax=Streptomyces sp. Je 1-79 TaxID=2943847 RepID=UPI0021A3578F|nr:DUF3017 domain-containing protein [Streptomyces sp. Je 1-79]MCT4355697.1 DUF3017 domain-containing protein [Streptomyces sp. Je 1-79]